MDPKILLIGSGAQAKYALEILHIRKQHVVGLVALPGETPPKELNGVKVLGDFKDFEEIFKKNGNPSLLLCCSQNKMKEKIETNLSKYNPKYINAIHPAAVIARTAILGYGMIINANAVIQPYARIGNHAMIHSGVIVEHDCIIHEYANLAPNVALAGYVEVGRGAVIYTGAIVVPAVTIGDYAVIGAGGVVLKDVEDYITVVGIPAQQINKGNTVWDITQ